MSEPTCIWPLSTRCPPNQITATLETFTTSSTSGNIDRHPAPGAHRHRGEVAVGGGEPLGLVRLADERAHDADAGDLLAQHPVDLVDAQLHEPEAAAPSG